MCVSRRELPSSAQTMHRGFGAAPARGIFAPDEQRWALQPLEQLKPEPCVYCKGRKNMSLLANESSPKQADHWGWFISKRTVFFVESEAALPNEAGSN